MTEIMSILNWKIPATRRRCCKTYTFPLLLGSLLLLLLQEPLRFLLHFQ